MESVFQKTFRPGEKWSGFIGRNKYVQFRAGGDNANVSLLLYNLLDRSERYNMPDSLKAQFTAHLTTGNILMSDNGRVLASIVEDTTGWIDSISGYSTRQGTDEKYGKTSYQENRNDYYRCGEENFRVELERNNMSARDLVPCVNLFSKVYVKEDGSMNYDPDNCKKGDIITLKTEMDVILIASNTPNPLDTATEYSAVPVYMTVYDAPATDLTDICVTSRPENRRCYENTWDYYKLLGSKF